MTFRGFPPGPGIARPGPLGDPTLPQRIALTGITAVDSSPSGNPRTYTLPAAPHAGQILIACVYSQEGFPALAQGLNTYWAKIASGGSRVSSFATAGLFMGILPRVIPSTPNVTITYDSVTTGGASFAILAATRPPIVIGGAEAHSSSGGTITPTVTQTGGRFAISVHFSRGGATTYPAGWNVAYQNIGVTAGSTFTVAFKYITPGEPVAPAWIGGGEQVAAVGVLG